jgi:hypothetical protein
MSTDLIGPRLSIASKWLKILQDKGLLACNILHLFEVPTEYSQRIPDSSSPAHTILDYHSGFKISRGMTFRDPSSCFSRDPPNTPCFDSKNSAIQIPDYTFLLRLWKIAPQAVLDGFQSILDPQTKLSTQRYPLFVVIFWLELSHLDISQVKWKAADEWLVRNKMHLDRLTFTNARAKFHAIPWNAPLPSLERPMSSLWLSDLLTDKPVDENLFEILRARLSSTLKKASGRRFIVASPGLFSC